MFIKDLLPKTFDKLNDNYIDSNQKEKWLEGIKTNFGALDELTDGLQNRDLIIIGSRPAMGKTALALNIATNISMISEINTMIFSLKLTKEVITQRILCAEAEISTYHFRVGNLPKELWGGVTDAVERLVKSNIYINDIAQTPETIEKQIKEFQKKYGNELVVFIDDLQMLCDEEEVLAAVRKLKMTAKQLNVPIVLLSNLNPWLERRENKRPKLIDLSTKYHDITGFADLVLLLYRDEYYNPDTDKKKLAELMVAKHVNGPIGTVELFFDSGLTKFSGLEK
jgi:replicative DNA helicase